MGDELLIKNGHVIDPANKINRKCDVLIADEKFVEVGRVKKQVQGHRRNGQTRRAGPD